MRRQRAPRDDSGAHIGGAPRSARLERGHADGATIAVGPRRAVLVERLAGSATPPSKPAAVQRLHPNKPTAVTWTCCRCGRNTTLRARRCVRALKSETVRRGDQSVLDLGHFGFEERLGLLVEPDNLRSGVCKA